MKQAGLLSSLSVIITIYRTLGEVFVEVSLDLLNPISFDIHVSNLGVNGDLQVGVELQ